jgi:hypothetical protein
MDLTAAISAERQNTACWSERRCMDNAQHEGEREPASPGLLRPSRVGPVSARLGSSRREKVSAISSTGARRLAPSHS